ncbi:MAG: DUF2971 domain-containing protein [Alphaproteobacteria bacterium]|nr:DUF2971 domain-containing protein [Alphaproteobacteria bacterium]
MDQTSPPDRIVRFYGNPNYALETIALKQITFIRSNKFNDPFDPHYRFITDFKDYNELVTSINQSSPDQVEHFTQALTEERFRQNMEKIKTRAADLCNRSYILSTCSVRDNHHPKNELYMWSHYANGHRGIAIEFNFQLLSKSFESNPQVIWSGNMEYHDDIPTVTGNDFLKLMLQNDESEITRKLNRTTRMKNELWKREREWRFIIENGDTTLDFIRCNLPENSITSIYLGCRSETEMDKKLILEKSRNYPNAKVHKMKPHPSKFALDYDEIV